VKLFDSTVFQFCGIILFVSGLAALTGEITWAEWLDASKYLIGIYATKESVKYGATAYKEKG